MVELLFDPVSGVVRYDAEARRDDGMVWVLPSANNRLLLDRGRYTIRLRACNEIVCSAFGNSLSVEVTQAPLKSFVPIVGR